jgi:purine-binding chemotaxis protein CheW
MNSSNSELWDSGDIIGDSTDTREYVTASVDGQLFGIPVLSVQDVLGPQALARIPLAPKEVAGALNLRGRIVTAIDLRRRLGLEAADKETSMSVVVDYHGELYSLLIDEVGEVLSVPASAYEQNPATLNPHWREVSGGIYRLDGVLMVILEVDRLLELSKPLAA